MRTALLGLAALAMMVSACDSKKDADDLVNKLRSCGLLSSGRVDAPAELSDYERCLIGCQVSANCSDLESLYCGGGPTVTLSLCAQSCEGPDFQCDDGSTIPSSWECDGDLDCPGGEDENGCPVFTCDDGSTVPPDYECDGFPDCPDQSDEAGCPAPELFTCDDGSTIPAHFECDMDPDCPNGEDEDGCAQFTCPVP